MAEVTYSFSALKEWASKETVISASGVAVGSIIAEVWKSMVVGWFDWTDKQAKWGGIVAKGVLSIILYILARKMTGGAYIFMASASVGSLASAIIDILRPVLPTPTEKKVVINKSIKRNTPINTGKTVLQFV